MTTVSATAFARPSGVTGGIAATRDMTRRIAIRAEVPRS